MFLGLLHFGVNFLDFLQQLHEVVKLGTKFEHGPLGTVEWLHAREPPSFEFIEIDDAVSINIQIYQCIIDLLGRKSVTQFCRQRTQLFSIDLSTAVFIELLESRHHIFFHHFVILAFAPIDGIHNTGSQLFFPCKFDVFFLLFTGEHVTVGVDVLIVVFDVEEFVEVSAHGEDRGAFVGFVVIFHAIIVVKFI